jgi:two-component system sensor histidine kinase RegB
MPAAARPAPELAPALNVRRLLWIRMIAIPGAALLFLLAQRFYGLPLRVLPLVVILLVLAVYNLWIHARISRGGSFTDRGFFVQMLVDVVALSGILYYSGGASNPFVFFFLLPLTITATVLPRRYTWAMALITACCYTALLFASARVPDFMHHMGPAFGNLHVTGMWIGFVVIAGLIAHFVAAMAETLRERDQVLAQARERALRDERVLALGTLAAGAAHELSTPLATMNIVIGELLEQHPAERERGLNAQLRILRDQIARCKEALSVISASAGAARAEGGTRAALDTLVADIVAGVERLRPGARIALVVESPGPAPQIFVERTLTQAILNIIHNAVDASPAAVTVRLGWDDGQVRIMVEDRGGGIHGEALDHPGRSSKEGGLGLGLFLSRSAIAQCGGTLSLGNQGAGALVTVTLPLAGLSVTGGVE